MTVAVRSRAVAGTVLAAAGALAIVPVTAPAGPPRVVSAPIAMAALPSWLQWVDDGTDLLAAQIAAIANGIQNELEDPLPIATTVLTNQVINVQDVGGALVTSAQVALTGLVSVPDLLLNAVFDAIANPLGIPLILAGLVADVVNTATAAVAPLGAVLTDLVTTTVTRAFGAGNAVLANLGPIGAALIGVPVAIGTAIVNAGVAVAGSVLTLNPFAVIGAIGDGLVDVEAASFNSVAAVAAAAGDLRSDVRTALAFPRPAAAVPASAGPVAARAAAAQVVPTEGVSAQPATEGPGVVARDKARGATPAHRTVPGAAEKGARDRGGEAVTGARSVRSGEQSAKRASRR